MSDFTAKLGMLKGSMRTVTPGGSRGVWFRTAELHELLEHRRQIDQLATKASTDTERAGVEALLSEAGDRIEVSRRRLEARRKGLGQRRVKVAEAETQALTEAKAAWFRAVGRLTASWSERRQREKHVESVVVSRSEASSRPCLPGPVAEANELGDVHAGPVLPLRQRPSSPRRDDPQESALDSKQGTANRRG